MAARERRPPGQQQAEQQPSPVEIDKKKLKKAFDISHFDINAILRGVQLTLVGGTTTRPPSGQYLSLALTQTNSPPGTSESCPVQLRALSPGRDRRRSRYSHPSGHLYPGMYSEHPHVSSGTCSHALLRSSASASSCGSCLSYSALILSPGTIRFSKGSTSSRTMSCRCHSFS